MSSFQSHKSLERWFQDWGAGLGGQDWVHPGLGGQDWVLPKALGDTVFSCLFQPPQAAHTPRLRVSHHSELYFGHHIFSDSPAFPSHLGLPRLCVDNPR